MLWLVAPEQRRYTGDNNALMFGSTASHWDQQLDDMISDVATFREAYEGFPRPTANITQAIVVVDAAVERYMNEIMTAKAFLAQIVRTASEPS